MNADTSQLEELVVEKVSVDADENGEGDEGGEDGEGVRDIENN